VLNDSAIWKSLTSARRLTLIGGVSRGPFGSLNLALHVGDDDEAVVENRRRALGALGGRLEELVVAEQVHGTTVTVVASEAAGRGSRSLLDAVPGTDALVTHGPGLTLAVLVADCAPVVLFDPHAAVVGCAHAGWRGALGGVIEATIEAMGSLGARPERLLVGVGPAIAGQRYEVGDEVADAARRHLGPHPRCLSADSGGRWRLDLAGAGETLSQIVASSGGNGSLRLSDGWLEQAAISALSQSRYHPVLRDGLPIAQRAQIRVRFAQ